MLTIIAQLKKIKLKLTFEQKINWLTINWKHYNVTLLKNVRTIENASKVVYFAMFKRADTTNAVAL